jgi:hypothetical protein
MLSTLILAYSAAVSAEKGSEALANALILALEARGFTISDTPHIRITLKATEALSSFYISVGYELRSGKSASSQYAVGKDNPEALKGLVGEIASVAWAMAEWGKPVGSATIITEPPGASVYVNGAFQGNSPITIRGFETGREYVLKAYKTGYAVYEGKISLSGVATDTLRLKLWPVGIPSAAYREKADFCADCLGNEEPAPNWLGAVAVVAGLLLLFGCLI